jgi:ABC-type branched-subunit amino acid transport system ATPase component/predicted MFS family arabinose efflux permease
VKVRNPFGQFRDAAGEASTLPLGVLFVLNMVDELDQVTFGVVAPNIQETFDVSETTITSLTATTAALVIMLAVPVGVLADRFNRVRMTAIAGLLWGGFTILTGLSGFIGVLGLLFLARFGAGIGRLMNEPVHVSLLADYYPPVQHGKVFSLHRTANSVGGILVLACGALADVVGWRIGFMLLAVPTFVAVLLSARLTEPIRGASQAAGLAALTSEEKVPFRQAWRSLKAIPTLQRSWWSAFFLGTALVPIAVYFNFFFENEFGVTSITARAAITSMYSVGAIIGLQLGSKYATRALMAGDLPRLTRYGGVVLGGSAVLLILLASSPWLAMAIVFTAALGLGVSFNSFGLPVLAAVAPPRLRSQALGWFVFFIGLGAILATPIIGNIGEENSYRVAISILSVNLLLAAVIYFSSAKFVKRDAEQAFATLLARSAAADADTAALLSCRGVEVAYDQVQVLFGVDMDVHPGEIVALLGTNGAGKSTLLKAISGAADPIGGSIMFAGEEITHTDAVATVSAGIVQVPGGKAVFPTLTVAEHLRAGGWLYRDDAEYLAQATEEVYEIFPRLRERKEQLAGNLSGGEQQMLALGMAFIAKPKLLMIDELSLGLAPTIVEQLLGIVRRIRDEGTAIVLVEQSINVALTVAERAYFLEKGEVRFDGLTAELLERDDIVRSVFLEGAAGGSRSTATAAAPTAPDRPPIGAPVLELHEVRKSFGGIQAVGGATFELREHEILGLIGPNGAGKTTIFDLVSGFLTIDDGRIVLDGDDITTLGPDKRAWRGLGRSFQDARLIPSLTVAENIAIGLERFIELRDPVASALGLPGIVRQEEDVAWTVEDLIEMMNLGAFRDKFVRELSTGSRRIVDLAMCIAHDPKVLLLDEPSSGIAQKETEALGPLLRTIQSETGCALLIIEHDMPLITGISDRMIALELGVPIAEGTPAEVVNDPRVVSSYLGGDMATINRSGATPASNGNANGNGRAPGGRRRTRPLVADHT